MKRAASRGSCPALCIAFILLSVLCTDGPVWAQVGIYSRPSDFDLPSQQVGRLGGRYTYSNSSSINTTPLAPETNPLNVKMAPQDGYGGGTRTDAQGRTIPSFISPAYSTVPPSMGQLGAPMAGGMGAPMALPLATLIGGSAPQYGATLFHGRSTLFSPTVKADSFSKMPPRREASLDNVTPYGPTASALEPREPSPATQPSPTLEALQQMSQHQAVRLSDEGAACLQRAMEALKAERFRSQHSKHGTDESFQPGAIDLFRQARLLLTDRPEPTLGLIASLASTTDYNQAAALIGTLTSQWPEVMSRDDFARVFHARPEQARMQMLAIREITLERGDANLRLLWAFYRWHMESRQAAANDVAKLVRELERNEALDSPTGQSAMALTRAMVTALGTGG
jgi:hypothetical protein